MKIWTTANRQQRRCFTLVELLTVIAIIAILLAILLPTLARAKYLARLAVCTNNLHQTGLAVLLYASDNNMRLPSRQNPQGVDWRTPSNLVNTKDKTDDRPMFIALGLQELHCPFTEPVDWYQTASPRRVNASYSYYFGLQFGYPSTTTEKPFKKTTDKMTFTGQEFDTLASDATITYGPGTDPWAGPHNYSSHPDGKYLAASKRLSGDTIDPLWYFRGAREKVDLNFLKSDGSVHRVSRVTMDDRRLEKVPYKWTNRWVSLNDTWSLLPEAAYY